MNKAVSSNLINYNGPFHARMEVDSQGPDLCITCEAVRSAIGDAWLPQYTQIADFMGKKYTGP